MAQQYTGNNDPMMFKADLEKFAKQMHKDISLVTKATVFMLWTAIILRSPIDQGRFVGSWGIERGKIGSESLPKGSKGTKEAALLKIKSLSFSNPFSTYWIYNNLPYAAVIEYGLYPGTGPKTIEGYSTQAPAGVVRVAIADVEAHLHELSTWMRRG